MRWASRSSAPSRRRFYAYLLGLAVIQSAVALAALNVAGCCWRKSRRPVPLRLIGAGIAGIGIAVLVQQVVPAV